MRVLQQARNGRNTLRPVRSQEEEEVKHEANFMEWTETSGRGPGDERTVGIDGDVMPIEATVYSMGDEPPEWWYWELRIEQQVLVHGSAQSKEAAERACERHTDFLEHDFAKGMMLRLGELAAERAWPRLSQ